jgi:carboxylate-amine ligase
VKPQSRSFAPLSVVGLELEYAIVDAALQPQCLVEQAFRILNGRPTSDVAVGGVGFSNELAAHVFEEKMLRPSRDLRSAEDTLHRALQHFQNLLEAEFGARLLPTGMHPLMSPHQTHLWRRGGRAVYRAYADLFDVREHGWVNIQSCHVNLPFGRTERDLVLLYNAAASLLPYLPAVAASSPLVEGRVGPHLDNRVTYYGRNQSAIPCITGTIVPEFISSVKDYRSRTLLPIYEALKKVRGGKALCHEWVNSRGAILRFSRRALEIRILDVQECVRMDVAVAAFTRAALRYLMQALDHGEVRLPSHGMLTSDLSAVIKHGRRAVVQARHFKGPGRASVVLERILDHARVFADPSEEPYLDLVAQRIEEGSLSERILRRLRAKSGQALPAGRVRDVYEELVTCLAANLPWGG